jgi:glucokinase
LSKEFNVFVADVGATKTITRLYCNGRIIHEKKWKNATLPSLEILCEVWKQECPQRLDQSGIALAAPKPLEGSWIMTNCPWVINLKSIEKTLRSPVTLLNDVEALAYGVVQAKQDDFFTIREGKSFCKGNQAVIALGTGVGQAGILKNNSLIQPFSTEGGFNRFSPACEEEVQVLLTLSRKFKQPVFYEDLLSGRGLVNIYQVLTQQSIKDDYPNVEELFQKIVNKAQESDELALRTVNRYSSILGVYVANLVFMLMATGGVYLGGGVLTRLSKLFSYERFEEAFLAQSKVQRILKDVPIFKIKDDRLLLDGIKSFISNT